MKAFQSEEPFHSTPLRSAMNARTHARVQFHTVVYLRTWSWVRFGCVLWPHRIARTLSYTAPHPQDIPGTYVQPTWRRRRSGLEHVWCIYEHGIIVYSTYYRETRRNEYTARRRLTAENISHLSHLASETVLNCYIFSSSSAAERAQPLERWNGGRQCRSTAAFNVAPVPDARCRCRLWRCRACHCGVSSARVDEIYLGPRIFSTYKCIQASIYAVQQHSTVRW